jgi:hypothetical protein
MEPRGIPLSHCSTVADPGTVLAHQRVCAIARLCLAGDPVDVLQSAYDH